MLSVNKDLSFHPEFCVEVSNDDDEIIGFKDLNVNIDIMASSLYANITMSYSSKADNADELMLKFDEIFVSGYTINKEEFNKYFDEEKKFKPYGKLIREFENKNEHYEVFIILLVIII